MSEEQLRDFVKNIATEATKMTICQMRGMSPNAIRAMTKDQLAGLPSYSIITADVLDAVTEEIKRYHEFCDEKGRPH